MSTVARGRLLLLSLPHRSHPNAGCPPLSSYGQRESTQVQYLVRQRQLGSPHPGRGPSSTPGPSQTRAQMRAGLT